MKSSKGKISYYCGCSGVTVTSGTSLSNVQTVSWFCAGHEKPI